MLWGHLELRTHQIRWNWHRFPQPCWALDTAPLLAERTGEISPARQSRGSSPVEPVAIAIHYWFLEVSWRSSAQSLIFYQSQLIFRVTLEFYLSDLDFCCTLKTEQSLFHFNIWYFWWITIPPRAESHLAIGLTASHASDLGSCAISASNPDGFLIWRLTYPSENMKVNGKDYPIYIHILWKI